MTNRSSTFAAKLLWLFAGTVLVSWAISTLLLMGILHEYTEQTRADQLKWLQLYTRTFVPDIRVGNTVALRTKLRMLIQSEGYLTASVQTTTESIRERATRHSHAVEEHDHLSWAEKKVLSFFSPPSFSLPLQDAAQVTWGKFEIVADPTVFYHGIASTILTSILGHLGLLLIFLGLLIFAVRRQILPLQLLTRSVSFYANSDRSLPEDLEAVLKHPVPGASEELVVLKSALEKAVGKLLQAQTRLNDQRVQAELTKIALQVAHDIRSPLCVLKIMSQEISKAVSKDQNSLVSGAIEEIQSIAEDLLSRYRRVRVPSTQSEAPKEVAATHSRELIIRHVESVLNSTRMELLGTKEFELALEHDANNSWGFAAIEIARFKRALSNIVRNALEAIPEKGKVTVKLELSENEVLVTTTDNGSGIPPEIIQALQSGGASSTTKHLGHGLGLQYAWETAQVFGGSLHFGRAQPSGTSICMTLPRTTPPLGITSGIQIEAGSAVVLLDDDPAIHAFWKERFRRQEGELAPEVHYFSKPGELFRWMHSVGPSARDSRFLMDLELGDALFDGIRILEQLDLWSNAVLISGREERLPALSEKYGHKGLTILPKSLLTWVPILLPQNSVMSLPPPLSESQSAQSARGML